MSNYLLDTSTILWAMAAPDRLSTDAREAIESGTLSLSVISYWEVMLKANKGLLDVGDPAIWWHRATEELSAHVLPLRSSHITALNGLPEHHKDPFDRMLVAQALADGLTIITSDETIHRYPAATCW